MSELTPEATPVAWRDAITKVRAQLGQGGGTGTAGAQNSITEREVGGWVLDAVEDELFALYASPIAPIGTPVETGEGVVRMEAEPYAWEGYWAGAGSVNSETCITGNKARMEQWVEAGAEITPLFRVTRIKSALEPTPSTEGVTEARVEAAAKAVCIVRGGDPATLHQINVFTGEEPFDHEDAKGLRYTYAWRGQVEYVTAALRAALEPQEPR